MLSKGILVLAVIFSILYPILDVKYHGHYTDAYLQSQVVKKLANSNISTGDDIKVYVSKRWVTLEGTLPANQENNHISRTIADIAGTRGVSNQLEDLNTKLLEKLKAHIKNNPEIPIFDYVISNDRIVTLTGHALKDSLKYEIEAIVASIRGVKKVQNNMQSGPFNQKIEEMIINILRWKNIYFDFNTANIRTESLPALDKIAEIFKQNPKATSNIEGHTDNIGSVEYNQKLSEARANAVKNALVERGVAATRLTAVGFGKSRPVSQNSTPETRAENRRIEFKVKENK